MTPVPGTVGVRHRFLRRGGSGNPAAERGLVEVVDEGPLAVDLDHRQPLPVAGLELVDAADVHLLVGEPELGAERGELRPRPLAERAVPSVEERDARDKGRG